MTFDYTFDIDTGHLTILAGSTEIPDDAFLFRDDVTSVSIPDSVTTIGDWAFEGAGLTAVVIPDSVTSIGMDAFSENNLEEVVIPSSVSSISSSAFSENNLEEVVIPSSVTSIGSSAFSKNNLEEVAIPSSVTSIGSWAFWANNLTKVVILDSVTTIYPFAFASNSLNEVDLGNSVTSIGYDAFSLNNLTEIIIPDSVTSIGDDAFINNELTEVELPGHFESNPPYNAFDWGVEFIYRDAVIPPDLNGDGFVDQVTNYQLWKATGGVDLTNRRGRAYSDDSSRMWDAIKAVEVDGGFSVLVEGQRNKDGKYKVATANEEGVVGGATRWLNGNQMTNEGYEDLFAMDFNGNGVIDLV